MKIWEARVRETVSSAPSRPVLILRNMFPDFLDNLIVNISPESVQNNFEKVARIGTEHGEQRAFLLDYTFSQLLLEYRILRQVIFEVLEQEKMQDSSVRDIILNVLDEGIQKAIEEFSRVRMEELRRSNLDLEHFASIAAHDLKSPLATIAGFAELLDADLKGKIELDDLEYIHTIRRSAARMTLLIDHLLAYSATGQELKPFEPVPIEGVLSDVLENLKPTIEGLNAKVHYQDLPTVLGDRSLLNQLFQNLIGNGLKFHDPSRQPEIHIEAKKQNGGWLFSIRDNGIGFNPKDKEKIFHLFKKLSFTPHDGVGIGLATVRKVVELHGGKVWAESELGAGSTFFFTLPQFVKSGRLH